MIDRSGLNTKGVYILIFYAIFRQIIRTVAHLVPAEDASGTPVAF